MSASILRNVVEKITIVLWECNVDVEWMELGILQSEQNVHEGQHFTEDRRLRGWQELVRRIAAQRATAKYTKCFL